MKFSLVIPAKNEEKRILLPLLEYYAALQQRFGSNNFEIIVVINNTTDKSAITLQSVKEILKATEIRIFDIGTTESKGRAVVYGLRKAKGNIIGFTDADGSYNAHEVMRMYRKLVLNKVDAIIPNRYLSESQLVGELPLARRVYSRIFNVTVRNLFGIPFTDTQGGLKLFTKKAVLTMLPQIITFGWACDVNMIVALRNSGMKVTETAIEWSQQAGSKLSFFLSGIEIFKEIWTLVVGQYLKRPFALLASKN